MPVGKSSIARAVSAKNAPVSKVACEEKTDAGKAVPAAETVVAQTAAPAAPKKPGRKPKTASAVTVSVEVAPKLEPVQPKTKSAGKSVKARVISKISPETVKVVRKGEETYAIGQELPRYLL